VHVYECVFVSSVVLRQSPWGALGHALTCTHMHIFTHKRMHAHMHTQDTHI